MGQGLSSYDSDPGKTLLAADGTYKWKTDGSWTSGFFPGLLWQVANFTRDKTFSDLAAKFTAGRESVKTETSTHDIGFVIFGSFGNGLELNGANATYSDVIVEAAHSLAVRYQIVRLVFGLFGGLERDMWCM